VQRLASLPESASLRTLTPDGRLLFLTRTIRLFAYGLLAVVLALYLSALGLSDPQIGLVLTLTLLGDAAISLWLTTHADRIGRRRTLFVGAGLMVVAGIAFALTRDPVVLTLAAIVGTISPSGNEVGPCQSIEQAALPQTAPGPHRTHVFAWYNLVGYFATAAGAYAGGTLAGALQAGGWSAVDSYRAIVVAYAACGGVLALAFSRLSPRVEVPAEPTAAGSPKRGAFGLHRSRDVVMRLAALSMLDSFGGGLVVQTLIAYWFHLRWGVEPAVLGGLLFGANVFAGLSTLAAARIAGRIGLLNTMVFTHIPSNVLLMLVPLMPTLPLAVGVLLARFCISQMDVPTRQSYLVAVVDPDERSAASGVTTIARVLASAAAPVLTGLLLAASPSAPFLLAGAIKIVYDVGLLKAFGEVRPPEEVA
jgi:MFS family permease